MLQPLPDPMSRPSSTPTGSFLGSDDGAVRTSGGLRAVAAAPKDRKPRELELDVLLGHELGAGSAAARVLWSAVGPGPPADVTVRFQVTRASDGRTTDVVAESGSLRLLCEDKLADGVPEHGQLEGLAAEAAASPDTHAVVVAPQKFITRYQQKLDELHLRAVSVEDLAGALATAAIDLHGLGVSELGRSYDYRAAALRKLCESITPILSPSGIAFRNAYDAVVSDASDGRVRLQPGTLTQGGGFAEFESGHPMPPGMYVAHKLRDELLDVTVRGWTVEALKVHLDALPVAGALPAGWAPAVPRMARAATPVLRHEAPHGPPDISSLTIDEATAAGAAAATGVAGYLLELADWMDVAGSELLHPPSVAILSQILRSALAIATSLSLDDVAADINAVTKTLNDQR